MAAAGTRAASSALLALLCAACTSINADQRTFEGSRWQVVAINQRPTPSTADYRAEFKNGSIAGRFGCNSFGGRYSVEGDTLHTPEIASTLMGCPEPSATFESAGFAILRQPMRFNWSSGRQLTLSNPAGSIALDRIP